MSLKVFFQAMLTVSTTNTRFTPAGMETLHGFKVFTIDISFTELQGTHQLKRHIQILCIDGRGQPVFAVICPGNSIFHICKLYNRENGPECFFLDNIHLLCTISQKGRFKEVAFSSDTFASISQGRPLLNGFSDFFFH